MRLAAQIVDLHRAMSVEVVKKNRADRHRHHSLAASLGAQRVASNDCGCSREAAPRQRLACTFPPGRRPRHVMRPPAPLIRMDDAAKESICLRSPEGAFLARAEPPLQHARTAVSP
jgi:hypothetical protein